jgi:hypothetical protein
VANTWSGENLGRVQKAPRSASICFSGMMIAKTALRKGLAAAMVAAATLASALPVSADPLEKVRENLFRRQGGEAAGPPLARYVSEQGRVFILDRTQPVPMLKFQDSPEVWALHPAPAPRGDMSTAGTSLRPVGLSGPPTRMSRSRAFSPIGAGLDAQDGDGQPERGSIAEGPRASWQY